MEYITDKTQANELSQINIPKCYAGYVNTAIASSVKLLTMKEFIDITGFEVDSKTFDILFMNINDEGVPIYINADMLNWMGYTGEEKTQLLGIKKHIERNFEESDYKLLKNKEYKTFLKDEIKGSHMATLNFPEPTTGASARSKTHLIVMPEAFRHLCMMINTNKGKQIRKYYTTLEKLIKSYNLYQTMFRCREAEYAMSCKGDKIDNLLLEIKENEKKADEERKKADEERKKADERFNRLLGVAEDTKEEVLEKISELAETRLDLTNVVHDRVSTKRVPNNRYEYLVILKDADDLSMPYYVLRTQRKSVSRRITSIQKDYNVEEVFRIYTPNSTKAWLSICDKFSAKIRKSPTPNWFALHNITEQEFKNYILAMDESERKNPKFI
jgi:phage anti-repressor protein